MSLTTNILLECSSGTKTFLVDGLEKKKEVSLGRAGGPDFQQNISELRIRIHSVGLEGKTLNYWIKQSNLHLISVLNVFTFDKAMYVWSYLYSLNSLIHLSYVRSHIITHLQFTLEKVAFATCRKMCIVRCISSSTCQSVSETLLKIDTE